MTGFTTVTTVTFSTFAGARTAVLCSLFLGLGCRFVAVATATGRGLATLELTALPLLFSKEEFAEAI
jgi:hypothetical protein